MEKRERELLNGDYCYDDDLAGSWGGDDNGLV